MPGKQVKNWKQYEALRKKGMSKEKAARITNAQSKRRKRMGKNRKPPAKQKKPRPQNAGIGMDGGVMGEGGMLTPVRKKKRK